MNMIWYLIAGYAVIFGAIGIYRWRIGYQIKQRLKKMSGLKKIDG